MPDDRRSFSHWLSRRVFRLPNTKRRAAAAVDDELEFHVRERVEEFVAAGMSRHDEEVAAQRRFGDIAALRSRLLMMDERARYRAAFVDVGRGIMQDVRFALRSLRRRPAF